MTDTNAMMMKLFLDAVKGMGAIESKMDLLMNKVDNMETTLSSRMSALEAKVEGWKMISENYCELIKAMQERPTSVVNTSNNTFNGTVTAGAAGGAGGFDNNGTIDNRNNISSTQLESSSRNLSLSRMDVDRSQLPCTRRKNIPSDSNIITAKGYGVFDLDDWYFIINLNTLARSHHPDITTRVYAKDLIFSRYRGERIIAKRVDGRRNIKSHIRFITCKVMNLPEFNAFDQHYIGIILAGMLYTPEDIIAEMNMIEKYNPVYCVLHSYESNSISDELFCKYVFNNIIDLIDNSYELTTTCTDPRKTADHRLQSLMPNRYGKLTYDDIKRDINLLLPVYKKYVLAYQSKYFEILNKTQIDNRTDASIIIDALDRDNVFPPTPYNELYERKFPRDTNVRALPDISISYGTNDLYWDYIQINRIDILIKILTSKSNRDILNALGMNVLSDEVLDDEEEPDQFNDDEDDHADEDSQ